MYALTEINPSVIVREVEYRRLLGYPKHRSLEDRARELADAAQEWFLKNGRSWIYAREVPSLEMDAEGLRIGGTRFSARRLREVFSESHAHRAVLVAVSAGKECEEHACALWSKGKPDEYFFLETFGSAVVEQLITMASERICAWADANQMAALTHFSPGYSGWDISEQIPLWNLFRQIATGAMPGELEVLESGMLRPKKSQLALVGLTRHLEAARLVTKLIPCENCSLPNCRYRRAPIRRRRPGNEHSLHALDESRPEVQEQQAP